MRDKQLQKWVDVWKERLLLHRWGVTIHCAEKDIPQENNRTLHALSLIDTQNSESKIRLYPALWKEPSGFQEMTIVHELAHIYTNPLKQALELAVQEEAVTQEQADHIVENLTNDIAKIAYKAYTRGRKNGGGYHL